MILLLFGAQNTNATISIKTFLTAADVAGESGTIGISEKERLFEPKYGLILSR